MITLNDDSYISKGAERKCYAHPEDPSKLIKIQYKNGRNQNNLDVFYYNHLSKSPISYSHIPKCYQKVDTTKGEGLVFDAIKNYDGEYAQSIEEIITLNTLSHDVEKQLLNELKVYLKKNLIIFGDVVLSNILCQEFEEKKYKLIIVDGLGARRFGLQFWLHTHSKFLTKIRIYKQWKKVINNYNEIERK